MAQVYRGLKNPDSTCYLNAVLQTLFMTKEFRKHVESLDRDGVSSDGNIIKELNELFKDLEKPEKTAVSAAGITRCLGIDVCKERDAAELLHEILKKTPGSSELFKGTNKTTITWRSCGHKQEPCQAFLSLIISLKDSQDVEKAVKAHFDQMSGVYPLRCCHCNSTDCIKKCEMTNFPKILSIQMKRSDDRPQIKVSSHKYELYAIVNYEIKTDRSGHHSRHYYADIECGGGNWYRFNDDTVSETPSDEIPPLRSSDAYLLVYRHRE